MDAANITSTKREKSYNEGHRGKSGGTKNE